MYLGFHKIIKQDNYSKIAQMFLEQQIRMISVGSRDPEDWSNAADNSVLP